MAGGRSGVPVSELSPNIPILGEAGDKLAAKSDDKSF